MNKKSRIPNMTQQGDRLSYSYITYWVDLYPEMWNLQCQYHRYVFRMH